MSLDLELFITDDKLETEGNWVTVLDGKAKVKVARSLNDKHLKRSVELYNEHDYEKQTDERKREIDLQLECETIFLDFEGFRVGGKDLENNLKNRMLIMSCREFKNEIRSASRIRQNFQNDKIKKAVESLGKS